MPGFKYFKQISIAVRHNQGFCSTTNLCYLIIVISLFAQIYGGYLSGQNILTLLSMKEFLVVFVFFASMKSYAQTAMKAQEKMLRNDEGISTLLNTVKNNVTTNSLARKNEYVIYSFTTTNTKIASLCIAKHTSATSGYIIYRFGTKSKIEFEFPSDTTNSFSNFTYSGYHRGGGIQNACMDIDNLRFENQGYEYCLYDIYTCEENKKKIGIRLLNHSTGKATTLQKQGKLIGYLGNLNNLVNISDEL